MQRLHTSVDHQFGDVTLTTVTWRSRGGSWQVSFKRRMTVRLGWRASVARSTATSILDPLVSQLTFAIRHRDMTITRLSVRTPDGVRSSCITSCPKRCNSILPLLVATIFWQIKSRDGCASCLMTSSTNVTSLEAQRNVTWWVMVDGRTGARLTGGCNENKQHES